MTHTATLEITDGTTLVDKWFAQFFRRGVIVGEASLGLRDNVSLATAKQIAQRKAQSHAGMPTCFTICTGEANYKGRPLEGILLEPVTEVLPV